MGKQKTVRKGKLLRIAVCLFIVYIAYSILTQQLEIRQRKAQLDALNLQCEQQQEANLQVERLLAMTDDLSYIERIARERLGFAYPNEKVYIDSSQN